MGSAVGWALYSSKRTGLPDQAGLLSVFHDQERPLVGLHSHLLPGEVTCCVSGRVVPLVGFLDQP